MKNRIDNSQLILKLSKLWVDYELTFTEHLKPYSLVNLNCEPFFYCCRVSSCYKFSSLYEYMPYFTFWIIYVKINGFFFRLGFFSWEKAHPKCLLWIEFFFTFLNFIFYFLFFIFFFLHYLMLSNPPI